MGPFRGPEVLLFILAASKALAANVDLSSQSDDDKEPKHMVAFTCEVEDQPMMYKTSQGWQINPQHKYGCLDKPRDILKLCREAYGDDVRNIVPVEDLVINSWPDRGARMHSRKASGYKCLIGEFQSEALLVPEGCQFKHLNSNCSSYDSWKGHAIRKCEEDAMIINGFSMLLPCKIAQYSGVEFVCCKRKDKKPVDVPVELPRPKEEISHIKIGEKQHKDAYTAYLQGDEEYLKRFENEHKKFMAAQDAMDKHHHDRISKMMAEWEESRKHIKEMKKTDPNGAEKMNNDVMKRFQLLLSGYEQADIAEKKQLVALHLQHVQAKFNTLKREFLEKYMTDLQRQPANMHKIYKDLRDYIKVEERDRQHTLNHFTHVRDHDAKDAKRIQPQSIDHLNVLDDRINQAMDMLHHFRDIELDVKPKIENFRKQYNGISKTAKQIVSRPIILQQEPVDNTHDITIDWGTQAQRNQPERINEVPEEGGDETEDQEDGENDTEVKIDDTKIVDDVIEDDRVFDQDEIMEDEHQEFIANRQHDTHGFQEPSVVRHAAHANTATGSVFGIAIGSIAVFVIIIVAVIMLRNHNKRRPITHGFVEVDPAASPEERHVANMQMNGYENPTYQYFELNQNQKV